MGYIFVGMYAIFLLITTSIFQLSLQRMVLSFIWGLLGAFGVNALYVTRGKQNKLNAAIAYMLVNITISIIICIVTKRYPDIIYACGNGFVFCLTFWHLTREDV